jgi:predicted metal-dependent hydrolase
MASKRENNSLEYKIIRSNRKSYGLKVTDSAEIIVKAPWYAENSDIERIVSQKEGWLRKKLDLMKNRIAETPRRTLNSGDKVLYLGDTLTINYDDSIKSRIEIRLLDLHVASNLTDNIKSNLEIWYKHHAKSVFSSIAEDIASTHGLSYQKIKLSSPEKRWGSCSSKGNINLNWRLIMAPERIVHYVIAHELAHTVHMNHSKAFWDLTEHIHPASNEDDKWLDDNGHKLYWD